MSGKIIKKDIVRSLYEKTGLPYSKVKNIVDDFFEEIKKTLLKKERVVFKNWGTFKIFYSKEKVKYDPAHKRKKIVKSYRKVVFRISPCFLKKLQKDKKNA